MRQDAVFLVLAGAALGIDTIAVGTIVLGPGLSCSGCFFLFLLLFFFIFGGKFAIVKRDARLDLVLVLAGLIFTSGFCVGGE